MATVTALALVGAACGDDSDDTPSAAATTAASSDSSKSTGCDHDLGRLSAIGDATHSGLGYSTASEVPLGLDVVDLPPPAS